ncbi:MAG: transglutaminase-like domain-containing protein [Planctomycetota bacterium]
MTRVKSSLILASLIFLGLGCASSSGEPSKSSSGLKGIYLANHDFTIDVPEGTDRLQAWFAMPSDVDPYQSISRWKVDAPYPTRVVRDTRGNNFLYMEALRPSSGELTVKTSFKIVREEVGLSIDPALTRPHTAAERARFATDLRPSSQIVIDDDVRSMATQAVGMETNPILVSRRLYDAVLDHVEYHVKDPNPDSAKTMSSSGTGSSRYAFEKCTGNCTDFHSLYAALSRSQGIPTRAVYGSFFKGPLDGRDEDQSYHCWIEFHAPNIGWIPLDVAVADIFAPDFHANEHSRKRAILTVANGYGGPDPRMVDYYFGNIDERRVVWHRGRDLVMKDPPQSGAPLLWNPKAYVELDGKASKAGRKLTYHTEER